ncbi:MAG: hypothetical protein ABIH39_07010 [Candidatus Margulisiibacteriota bacterium]
MKKNILYISLIVLGLFLIAGCSQRALDQASIQILNSKLETTDKIQVLDNVLLSMQNLKANAQYSVTITDSSGNLVSRLRYTTADNGNLSPVVIWYNAGLNTHGNQVGRINSNAVSSFTVTIIGSGTNVTLPFFLLDTNESTGVKFPIAAAAFSTGQISDSFESTNPTNDVYIWAENLAANTNMDVYIIRDNIITPGDSINGQYEVIANTTVSSTATGSILALIWDQSGFASALGSPSDRERQKYHNFDVILDVNRNGVFDEGIDLVDGRNDTGFTLQDTMAGILRLEMASGGFIGYDPNYGYKDTFYNDGSDTRERPYSPYNMYKGIKVIFNPYMKKMSWWNPWGLDDLADSPIADYAGTWADVYIVAADSINLNVNDTQALVDISGANGGSQVERVAIAASCQNGQAQVLVFPPAHMTNGDYWLIVDADRNGIWNNTVDFIDNLNTANDGIGFSIIDPPQ